MTNYEKFVKNVKPVVNTQFENIYNHNISNPYKLTINNYFLN